MEKNQQSNSIQTKILSSKRLGGKGSMRRKKIIRKRPLIHKGFKDEMLKNCEIINKQLEDLQDTDELKMANQYMLLFKQDIALKIQKEDKKLSVVKPKQSLTVIKQNVLQFLSANQYSTTFVDYCAKYLVEGCLNTINRYLLQIIDIFNVKEYLSFIPYLEKENERVKQLTCKSEEENNILDANKIEQERVVEAYKYFDLNPTQNVTPSLVRSFFKRKLESNSDRTELEKYYKCIIRFMMFKVQNIGEHQNNMFKEN